MTVHFVQLDCEQCTGLCARTHDTPHAREMRTRDARQYQEDGGWVGGSACHNLTVINCLLVC